MDTSIAKLAVETRLAKLAVETKLARLAVDTRFTRFCELMIGPKRIEEIYPAVPRPMTVDAS